MLIENIKIGDKTPFKIAVGENELSKICLGDNVVWNTKIDELPDIPDIKPLKNTTVYINNPEVFTINGVVATIRIGGDDIEIKKNNTGPFFIHAIPENNMIRCEYVLTTNTHLNEIEINVNGKSLFVGLGKKSYSNYFSKIGNEVHITFRHREL